VRGRKSKQRATPPSRGERGQEIGRHAAQRAAAVQYKHDAVRERKSKPRTAHPRMQSERKSLGATPPNRRRAAAVQATTLCENVSWSRAPPTLACRAGRSRVPRRPTADASQKYEPRCCAAAHSRVQSKDKSWAPRHRVN